MRKKILFINCSDGGSTGCIIKDITKLLNNQEWESYLCVPRITSDISIFKEVFETSMKYEQAIYPDVYAIHLVLHLFLLIGSKEQYIKSGLTSFIYIASIALCAMYILYSNL